MVVRIVSCVAALFAASFSLAFPAPAQSAELMYWPRSSAIRRLDLDSFEAEVVLVGTVQDPIASPEGAAAHQMFYWVDPELNRIERVGLDGTGRETVLDVESPTSIALDIAGGKMYWVQSSDAKRSFHRADLDGSNPETIIPPEFREPQRIMVVGSRLYWDQLLWNDVYPAGIFSANLDGSDIRAHVQRRNEVAFVLFGVDESAGQMYWGWRDALWSVPLDGGEWAQIATLADPADSSNNLLRGEIDFSSGTLYWVHFLHNGSVLQTTTLDGARTELLFDFAAHGLMNPREFTIIVAGDTNADGSVNLDDLNAVRNNFGQTGQMLFGDTHPFDGIVDIGDLNAVLNNFGVTAATAVPEPSTLALASLFAFVAVIARRRRI